MRRLVPITAVIALSLVVPAIPAGAETTVKPNGNVVRIAIAVDVVDAEGKTGPDGQPLVDYWEQVLQDTWGKAFGQRPYKNCYRFELRLKLKARADDFDSSEGRHRIIVGAPTGGTTFRGTGFDGTSETSRNPTTGDGTRAFEHDLDGAIPSDAPPTVVAHEFGHLFGLGDDRQNGVAKNGREGTLMVGGAEGVDPTQPLAIDKNLIDRLGRIIERYLEDQGKKPLSPCETWNGPIRTTYAVSISGVSCTGEENGTVTLAVVDDAVSGTIETSGSETCTGPASSITEPTEVVIRLAGTLEDREFRLDISEVIGSHALTPSCLTESTIEIAVERGRGSVELTASFVAGYTTTCNIMVERQTDEEPVG